MAITGRPRVAQITALSEALLAKRWSNKDEARTWLKRRGTSARQLGCEIVELDEGVRLVEHPLEPDAGPDLTNFDNWAAAVDELLQAADLPAETDKALMALFERGLVPPDAVEAIMLGRKAAKPAPAPAPAPAPLPDVVRATLADAAAAPHADTEPNTGYFVQLGTSLDRDTAMILAARASERLGTIAVVCEASTGRAVQTLAGRSVVALPPVATERR